MSEFEYNAPQYRDFDDSSRELPTDAEEFFELNHEQEDNSGVKIPYQLFKPSEAEESFEMDKLAEIAEEPVKEKSFMERLEEVMEEDEKEANEPPQQQIEIQMEETGEQSPFAELLNAIVEEHITSAKTSQQQIETQMEETGKQSPFAELLNAIVEEHITSTKTPLRKSVSTGDIDKIDEKNQLSEVRSRLEMLSIDDQQHKKLLRFEMGPPKRPSRLPVSAKKPTPVPQKCVLKPKSSSRDAIHLIDFQSKKRKASVESLHSEKYVSVAEAIKKFQFQTPERFHTKPSKAQYTSTNNSRLTIAHTVPHSPQLATRMRTRTTYIPSREDMEIKEVEEMKKHQVKAHPLNYNIFKTPVQPLNVEKKPITKLQPFKFTETHYNKPAEPKKEVYEFHAKPVPKTLKLEVKQPVKKLIPNTIPKTPTFMKKYKIPQVNDKSNNNIVNLKNVDVPQQGVAKPKTTLTKTKVKPFSFEDRDKLLKQRKEEKIRKILEEEKKAREFHANPIPPKVIGSTVKVESKVAKILSGNVSLPGRSNDENLDPSPVNTFKARPASVLLTKPFKPKKEGRHLIETFEFTLNTDNRMKERKLFDIAIRQKEMEIERLKEQEEEKKRKLEEQKIIELRKDTIIKAHPIKYYKPLSIHPSTKKLTAPISPPLYRKKND